jgi:hypothetical protein
MLTLLILVFHGITFDPAFANDDSKVKVDTHTDQDTAVLIHKGPVGQALFNPPEYKIVEGTEEIAGDPYNDKNEAYKSWKQACDDWKKELKANNGDRVIVASCGRPHMDEEHTTFEKTDVSTGSYKLKVLIREGTAIGR